MSKFEPYAVHMVRFKLREYASLPLAFEDVWRFQFAYLFSKFRLIEGPYKPGQLVGPGSKVVLQPVSLKNKNRVN